MSAPSPAELRDFLAIALRAANVARDVIMPIYAQGFAVETKTDGTPVTVADRGAEEALRAFLARECPGHGVIGEEFGVMPGAGPYRWVLDPIDGTKAFVRRVPLWGTLIALEYEERPVVGVIACHAADETAAAATGLGCTINGARARVSEVGSLDGALINTSSVTGLAAAVDLRSGPLGRVRTWGDCYGYLMVAAGRAEVMLDPVMNHWDIAALVPVIREAGGTITGWHGEPEPLESCVATNGPLHGAILAALGA